MRDKKRLDCRLFRIVTTERPECANPSELGLLREPTFLLAQVSIEGRERTGGIVELGEQKPAERDERRAPFSAVRIALVRRAVRVGGFAERSLRAQCAGATEEIAHRCARRRFRGARGRRRRRGG